jgi:hypothetical protein
MTEVSLSANIRELRTISGVDLPELQVTAQKTSKFKIVKNKVATSLRYLSRATGFNYNRILGCSQYNADG